MQTTTTVSHRPHDTARPSRAPDGQPGVLELPPAPPLPEAEGAVVTAVTAAVPLIGAVGSVAVVVSTGHVSAQGWLMAGGVLLASLTFAAAAVWRARTTRTGRTRRGRRAHAAQLARARRTVRAAARRQREESLARHPDPSDLASGPTDGTRRAPGDPDHLVVRYGVTDVPSALSVRVGDAPADQDPDPVTQHALDRFVATHGRVGGMPAVLRLDATPVLRIHGPLDPALALTRALVAQAAAAHDPRDLAVVLLAPAGRRARWEWLKWLPHARADLCADVATAQHLVADGAEGVDAVVRRLSRTTSGRHDDAHLIVVVDDTEVAVDPAAWPSGRVTVLVVDGDPLPDRPPTTPPTWRSGGPAETLLALAPRGRRRDARSRADAGQLVELHSATGQVTRAVADRLDPICADALARRLPRPGGGAADPGSADALTRLLHLDGRGRPAVVTEGSRDEPGLRVELGCGADGRPVVLDLEEAARGGAGPHGLVIGATGSGKSELLRTLVLGLVTAHHPGQLNLLLVDFKGGATFAGLRELPHVSAVITNMVDDLGLVDRMRDALEGELQRRQELLGAAGGLASRHDYETTRRTGRVDLPPLPRLLVVVDEFSELLSARPELVDLLVTVGRLGRSLGLHLLLASQRLEEGRLRGLDSHLSFRVALRTFSAAESRSVIGTGDAHALPTTPGAGYLRTGPDEPVRFTTTYVSGSGGSPVVGRTRPAGATDASGAGRPADRPVVRPFRLTPLEPGTAPTASVPAHHAEPPAGPSVLDLVVDRLRDLTPRARPVWLPPPDRSPAVADLLPDLARVDGLGLVSSAWRARGRLTVPLGVVDRPREQRYDVLTADLSGEAGHVAVVGGPRSGRSTTLATLVSALALTHTPDELQVFVLDFGGGTLAELGRLPHVAAVAGRTQPDLVRRVVAEVRAVADAREARTDGAPGSDARADGPLTRSEVLLVVDQWTVLRADFPDLEPVLLELAQRGLSHGVHLAVAATRWADLRPALRDVLGTRVELRLGDPLDSEVDRRQAGQVPVGRPGRALTTTGHHAVVARPALQRPGTPADAQDGGAGRDRTAVDGDLRALVTAVRDAWPGPAAPRLRLLPASVSLDEVRQHPAVHGDGRSLLLGLDADGLAPVGLDPADDPHLLVLGESRSGRTTVLRTLLHEVARRQAPSEAQVFLVDPRRALLGEVPDDRCADYAATTDEAARLVHELVAAVRARLPGPMVTPAQLRDRSWWRGPEAVLVVDDADLLTDAGGGPLAPLLPLLPHARDVGLRVLLARRSAGLDRRPDPVVTALRELDHPVLLLGADPRDGTGRRATSSGVRTTPPGRGRLVAGGGTTQLQVALPPGDDGPPA